MNGVSVATTITKKKRKPLRFRREIKGLGFELASSSETSLSVPDSGRFGNSIVANTTHDIFKPQKKGQDTRAVQCAVTVIPKGGMIPDRAGIQINFLRLGIRGLVRSLHLRLLDLLGDSFPHRADAACIGMVLNNIQSASAQINILGLADLAGLLIFSAWTTGAHSAIETRLPMDDIRTAISQFS